MKNSFSPSPMEDSADDFEPLFDYRRVQPVDFVCLDDDSDSEKALHLSPKRMKMSDPVNVEAIKVVDIDDEDWLLPPPEISNDVRKVDQEDETIKELRLKKQELALFAQSAEDVLRAVDESAERKLNDSEQSVESEADNSSKLEDKSSKNQDNRVKVVVSIQDKDELKQFRIYTDDKFERLFKMYAEKIKRDVGSLIFSFDGDKVSPTATPAGLGMEDEDIIEVRIK